MTFTIKPIQSLKDVSLLIRLHNIIWQNSTGIIDLLENSTYCHLLFEDKSGTLAGYLFIEDDTEKGFGEINDIVVDPKYRRLGCGKILLENVMKVYKNIKLNADATNKELLRFYQSCGFEEESVIENYYAIDRDAVRMTWHKA